jgi:hypothetical protein
MSGAIAPLPLYAFMVCIGTTLPLLHFWGGAGGGGGSQLKIHSTIQAEIS